MNSIARMSFLLFLALVICVNMVPPRIYAASTGLTDGTYDFGGLGAVDSGGAGFKKVGDKFVVPNGFSQDGTAIWSENQQNPNTTGQLTIKTEGIDKCRTFTFQNLGISAYDNSGLSLQSLSVSLYDANHNLLSNFSTGATLQLNTTVTQVGTLLNNGNSFNVNGVASLELSWKFTNNREPSNLNIHNITIANVKGVSTISPTTASFDKYVSAANYKDITTTMDLKGNVLSGIKNGSTPLVLGSDYTVSGSTATIKKEYLATQAVGTSILTFAFDGGTEQTLTITVSDTSPKDSTFTPTTASFDKYHSSVNYKDVQTTMTMNGNTLSSIKNGSTPLVLGTDYSASGSVVTIKKEYLATQAVGTTSLVFTFSAGATKTLAITISDTTPQNSTISPTTASFDKYTSATNYKDVQTTATLNGNTLSSIKNGSTPLVLGTDYTISGSTVTIKKEYLVSQAVGTTSLIFTFSAGATQTLTITMSDTTPPPTYTVTYNGNGETSGAAPTDNGTYEQGDAVSILGSGILAKTGYTFAGWNTAANGSGTSHAAGSTLT
ncbi:X2-like carbohydrate binding domain-containing protein, partial [Brevibacillus reuszeri]|uniref:X2-like carbohydrate binding domain-containing protein n=1 Tax=Brevibacillus reuszeri TaxID=54915 RepID=UPI002E1F4F68|nr:X2-like carbohydrate binding domain-containing protein [Brevibacillus reuszeri]